MDLYEKEIERVLVRRPDSLKGVLTRRAWAVAVQDYEWEIARLRAALLEARKASSENTPEPFSQLGKDAAWPAGSSRPPFDSL